MKLFRIIFLLLFSQSIFAQKIAILGAIPEEVQLLKNQLANPKIKKIMGFDFYVGKLNNKDVVLCETGVGKVNAAVVTTLIINSFKPKYIIFTGVAGGVDTTLNRGDILIGKELSYHDYGRFTTEGFLIQPSRNPHTKNRNPQFFKSDSVLVAHAQEVGQTISLKKVAENSPQPMVRSGIIVTGDSFVASSQYVAKLEKEYNADATEMEGAAVAQICFQENIRFLVIRSISDKANEQAQNDFQAFKKVAADNSAMLVNGIVQKLETP